jgi:simple sugar transport system substrate-binding protein
MRQGITRFAAETGVDARMTAAGDASPGKQVAIVRRLIAEKPAAITVVPNSLRSLERVLARVKRTGIFVVTLRGAPATANARFPDIRRIGSPIESLENAKVAYRKARALLAQHPDIKGFQGSSAVDVAGIGPAIREAGRQRTTCVMGTSTPATVGSYLKDGSVDKLSLWDPAVAGQAQLKLALRLINGRKVGPGLDLRLPGYRNLKPIAESLHGLHGSAWIDIGRSNARRFPF